MGRHETVFVKSYVTSFQSVIFIPIFVIRVMDDIYSTFKNNVEITKQFKRFKQIQNWQKFNQKQIYSVE